MVFDFLSNKNVLDKYFSIFLCIGIINTVNIYAKTKTTINLYNINNDNRPEIVIRVI